MRQKCLFTNITAWDLWSTLQGSYFILNSSGLANPLPGGTATSGAPAAAASALCACLSP